MFRNTTLLCYCTALVLLISNTIASSISLDKAIFKVSFVKGSEKVQRVKFIADNGNTDKISQPSGFEIDVKDSLSVQASFINDKGDPAYVEQLFLRFVNTRTGLDNLYIVKKKGREMRLDLKLYNEIRSDLQFWTADDTYIVQLIIGDDALDKSTSWTITKAMQLSSDSGNAFIKNSPKVFDFDVSIKKMLLPEFISPLPEAEKRAHPAVTLAALLLVLIPLPLLIVAWSRLGVFPLVFEMDKSQKSSVALFQTCIIGHLGALSMFWLQWNIVTTWKVISVLMIPTLFSGQKVLFATTVTK